MRPVLLDLFCGAGGASAGYHRAGFDVVGIDAAPMPNYPFEFHRDTLPATVIDAIAFVRDWVARTGAVAVAASPPCQHSSALTKGTNRKTKAQNHFDLIPTTRHALQATGLPWVIENVQGSELRRDLTLCGEMFGLAVIRHRYFEVDGFAVEQPAHIPHRGRVAGMRHGEWFTGPYFAVYGDGGGKGTVAQWQQAMGIDWTADRKEIAEAIPPAYTEFVGRQLIRACTERAA